MQTSLSFHLHLVTLAIPSFSIALSHLSDLNFFMYVFEKRVEPIGPQVYLKR